MTRASAVRHTAPKAAEPSAVMRLTLADGTNDGGISGAGGGEAGACADTANGIRAEAEASTAHAMRLRRVVLRIGLLPSFESCIRTNSQMWHKATTDKSVSCSVAPMEQSELLNDSFGSFATDRRAPKIASCPQCP